MDAAPGSNVKLGDVAPSPVVPGVMRSDVSSSSNTACAGTLASVAVRRREVEREGGGGGSNRRRAPRAARTVRSRHVMYIAAWRAARTERQAEGRERAAWSEGGAYRKRAEAESGKERMSRCGGRDRRGGRCVLGEGGVRERERRPGRD